MSVDASHDDEAGIKPGHVHSESKMLFTDILAAMFFGTIIWRGVIWWIDHGPPHEPPDWWRPER